MRSSREIALLRCSAFANRCDRACCLAGACSRSRPLAACCGVGACSRSSRGTADRRRGHAPTEVTASDFVKKSDYCPPIQIRAGTATMTVYERGHENETAYVRYLASISQTARECTMAGDALTIKVGIAGRVVAGPKGSAANVTLPLRVAVAKQFGGTAPLYSELFKIPVGLARSDFRCELQPGLRPGNGRLQARTTATSSSMSASTKGPKA